MAIRCFTQFLASLSYNGVTVWTTCNPSGVRGQVPGFYNESLAPFLAAHPGPVRLLHVDCDLYSSPARGARAAALMYSPLRVPCVEDF